MDGGGRSNQRKLAEATETDGAQRSPLTEISEAVLRHCMWVHVVSASSAHEGEQQVRERHMLVLVLSIWPPVQGAQHYFLASKLDAALHAREMRRYKLRRAGLLLGLARVIS